MWMYAVDFNDTELSFIMPTDEELFSKSDLTISVYLSV